MYIKILAVIIISAAMLPDSVLAIPPDTLWTRMYDWRGRIDGCYTIRETPDSGYIWGGSGAVNLIRTDASGDSMWSRLYCSGQTERGHVECTSDGGFIFVSFIFVSSTQLDDVFAVKTDSSGDSLWTHLYDNNNGVDRGMSVVQTSSGGYFIGARTRANFYFVRTDSVGDTLWTRTYDGSGNANSWYVCQTSDGGFAVAATGAPSLLRLDTNGDTLWTRQYGGDMYEVQQTLDDGFILVGTNGDFLVVKTDSIGSTEWTRTYGGEQAEYAYSVDQTSDGGYVVAGFTDSYGAGGLDFYVVKLDAVGDTLWTATYGGARRDVARCVRQTSDGGYIVAGQTASFGADFEAMYAVKLGTVPVLDVGVAMIVAPTDTIAPDSTVEPRAWIENYGGLPTFWFPVIFTMGGFYADTMWCPPLQPGDSLLITFSAHDSFPCGWLPVSCSTALEGDSVPENNWMEDSVYVRVPVGLDAQWARNLPLETHGPTVVGGAGFYYLWAKSHSVLLDISGRKVADMHPGANDIRHLAPGVYFLRQEKDNTTAKVVVQK